jgi:hypothetical protein
MINRLTGLEQLRLKQLGFASVVTPISITVDKALKCIYLGNDGYILTGVRPSDTDVATDTHVVTLASATDGLTCKEREFGLLGQAIHKTFRSFLIIKTTNADKLFSANDNIPAFTLDFIKITPIKQSVAKG